MAEPIPYSKAKDKDWVAQKPGAPTARFTKLIKVPVKLLMTLPGLRGEHQVLHPKMEKVKCFIPLVQDLKWQREHPIEIEVHHNGAMCIGDGNHRKLAADLAHLETYLCKVTFYGGSEDEVNFEKVMAKYAEINYISIVQTARKLIQNNGDLSIVTNTLNKLAEQEIGGNVDNFGDPGSQDYDNMREHGEDPAGENNPDIGQERRIGPRKNLNNDMVQEAARNEPCKICGMEPCQCISDKPKGAIMPENPKGPMNAKGPSNPKMADVDITDALIQLANMKKYASHMEEIEIPFKDLNLENGINYRMSGRAQEVTSLAQRYIAKNVYRNPVHFTIAQIQEEGNKFFVKCLVFDNQIDHEASSVTKADTLRKVSNVQPDKLEKTAWKKRLVEMIGDNDETGLVKCPLEGGFLTRSCAVCPLAGNPQTYIKDGYTECHFDDMTSWLNGNSVKEHNKETITGM